MSRTEFVLPKNDYYFVQNVCSRNYYEIKKNNLSIVLFLCFTCSISKVLMKTFRKRVKLKITTLLVTPLKI